MNDEPPGDPVDPMVTLAAWIWLVVEIVGGIGLGWLFAFVWLHM